MTESEHPVVPSKEESSTDICICEPHDSDFAKQVYVDVPYEAADSMRDLDWEKTHRTWDPDVELWEIDFEGMAYTIVQLTVDGYSISITESCVSTWSERQR